MTKKDFKLIADALRRAKPALTPDTEDKWEAAQYAQYEWTVMMAANALNSTNPRFNRARFIEACGL